MNRSCNNYDVIVVGAGPSGAMLSYKLAQNGVNVLLLEKYKLPRYKACGGGINLRTARLIPFDISEVVENTIYGAYLSYKCSSPSLRTYEKPLTYMVMRDKFDYFLACKAQEAGAQIIDQCKVLGIESESDRVTVKTNNVTYTAKFVIGADGANSIVAKSFGLARKTNQCVGIDCQIKVDDHSLAKWDRLVGLDLGGVRGGYSWIFPKYDCLSVGIGGPNRSARNLKSYLFRFIESQHFYHYEILRLRGSLMPLGGNTTSVAAPRALLVGDAAGLIDPFIGDGIYFSIRSAMLAAPVIMKSLVDGKTRLVEYDKEIKTELVPELQTGRVLSRVISRFPQLFVHLLATNDWVWNSFCRVLRGETTYIKLKQKLGPLKFLIRFL